MLLELKKHILCFLIVAQIASLFLKALLTESAFNRNIKNTLLVTSWWCWSIWCWKMFFFIIFVNLSLQDRVQVLFIRYYQVLFNWVLIMIMTFQFSMWLYLIILFHIRWYTCNSKNKKKGRKFKNFKECNEKSCFGDQYCYNTESQI